MAPSGGLRSVYLSEMRNALRSGDLWVTGSRQFKNYPRTTCAAPASPASRRRACLFQVEPDGERYLAERLEHLREELSNVNALAEQGGLPDAAITNGVLRVAPLNNLVPEEATAAMRKVYALLPHIRITELLLEVDHWTGFSRHFTHLKTGEPPSDPSLLLAVVLADGINLGLSKMAEACPEASYFEALLAGCMAHPKRNVHQGSSRVGQRPAPAAPLPSMG